MENQSNLLESHTPNAIIERLKSKEDCTTDLIELVKSSGISALKKIRMIFNSLTNYELEKIVELSHSTKRTCRYITTFLILSKIKYLCKKKAAFSEIEIMYDNVFVVRFRDVDPLIRAMCVEFISAWICESTILQKQEYVKYVGWALNDKTDSVRKRAVKSISKIVKKIQDKKLLECYCKRMLEIAEFDKNIHVQKEGIKAVLESYEIFSEDEIIKTLCLDDSVNTSKEKALFHLCPDGIWDLNQLHTILKKGNANIFKSLGSKSDSVNSFIQNITEFVRSSSKCCDSDYLCILDILKEFKASFEIKNLVSLFDCIKDNKKNISKIIELMCNTEGFKEQASFVPGLIDTILPYVKEDSFLVSSYVKLLKKLEPDFNNLVQESIDSLKQIYTLDLLRYFDVSDVVTANSKSIEKIYACLWKIVREEYSFCMSMQLTDVENYLELADFLAFFYTKAGEPSDLQEDMVIDAISASKVIFIKLFKLISANFIFETEEACLILYKLVNLSLFVDDAHILFKYCSEDTLISMIDHTKQIKALTVGYFNFIKDNKKYYNLSRIIASKVKKNESDRYIFVLVKDLVLRADLLDSVLINFVGLLSVNECIVIESMTGKSKFKTLCMRKCRSSSNKSMEHITFIN